MIAKERVYLKIIRDEHGEQKLVREKMLCYTKTVPKEQYLKSDIPVFEDQIEWIEAD
jgi:hypothetical protein